MARTPRPSPVFRRARGRAKARATPPRPDGSLPDAVTRIDALISISRGAWLGLLFYLAFIGVTLLGVEDADFFLTERQTALPLIGVSVPTNLFFAIAPALAAMLATYLHLYLVKLWEALAEAPLPEVDPSLADRIQPWELADFALSFRKGARTVETRPLGFLAWVVSLTLAFAATPAVLAAFWWRSMPKHDEVLTVVFCGVPLSFAIYGAVASFLRLRRIMRGDDAPLFRGLRSRTAWGIAFASLAAFGWLTTEGTFKAYAEISQLRILNMPLTFPSYRSRARDQMLADLQALSEEDLRKNFAEQLAALPPAPSDRLPFAPDLFETRRNQLSRLSASATADDIEDEVERRLDSAWWAQTWVPGLLRPAALQNVDFAYTPEDWQDFDQAEIAFRRDWCKANDLSATLCGPVPDRDAEPADHQVHARQVWCKENLRPITDEPPDQLSGRCNTHFADLDRSFAEEWKDTRQLWRDARRRRDLSGADLRGANLIGARMEGANLGGARMDTATNLSAATLRGAALRFVDYSQVRLSTDQVKSTLGDASVILPGGVTPGHPDWPAHWPVWKLPDDGPEDTPTFGTEWRRWQSDPTSYTPPPPPDPPAP